MLAKRLGVFPVFGKWLPLDRYVVAPVEDVGEHTTGADLGGDTAVVIVAVVIRSTIPAGWLVSSVSGQKLFC